MDEDEFGAVETQGCLTLILTLIGVRALLNWSKKADQAEAVARAADFSSKIALGSAARRAEQWNRIVEEHEVND